MAENQPHEGADTNDDAATLDPNEVVPPVDLVSSQLTVRALLTGMVLGGTLSICNVYLGLKIGWGTNMSITGILLGYAFWKTLEGITRGKVSEFGVLENNINQSACSSAAAVSSAGLVAPIPALALLTGETLSWVWLAIWVFSVCLVGITVATGLRHQMIMVDRLPFPGGLACGETLREIYGQGAEAIQRVRLLGLGALAGAVVKLLEVIKVVKSVALTFPLNGYPASAMGFKLDPNLLMVGVGGLVGIRVAASMMIGAILAWGVIGPMVVADGRAPITTTQAVVLPEGVVLPEEGPISYVEPRGQVGPEGVLDAEGTPEPVDAPESKGTLELKGPMDSELHDNLVGLSDDPEWRSTVDRLYVASQFDPEARAAALASVSGIDEAPEFTPRSRDVLTWLLWPGVTLMVVASLVTFTFSFPSMLRAFRGTGSGGEPVPAQQAGTLPRSFFYTGAILALVLSVGLQIALFEIIWWAAILGVLMSFALAIVGSRVSGETNITPVGAMGKVTQLVFGVLVPKSAAANLMAANVTGGAASQCADLMHDFKCGSMLGAAPGKQFFAQIAGAIAGAIVGSGFYLVLIPNPSEMLLTPEWPAPAVAAWKAVAEIFQVGFQALPEGTPTAMLIAAIIGVAFPIVEKVSPKRVRAWIPSVSSVGLAFVVYPNYSISMFIGAVIALILGKLYPRWTTRFLITICAGVIVGDSLIGAGDAFWKMFAG
ncbi:MAG: OPT family oligopeptide transporter [Planctomycetota bacterium]|nr:OPT family oligopeptide transporter [Planctomycetota bacterium]